MVAAGACQRFRCLKAMENCRAWTTSLRHRSVEGPPSVNRLVKSWVLRIDGSSPEGEEYLSLGREPWFERPHSPLCGPPLSHRPAAGNRWERWLRAGSLWTTGRATDRRSSMSRRTLTTRNLPVDRAAVGPACEQHPQAAASGRASWSALGSFFRSGCANRQCKETPGYAGSRTTSSVEAPQLACPLFRLLL